MSAVAKDTFIKACLRHYGSIQGEAVASKIIRARSRFLYQVGKLLMHFPESEIQKMIKLNNIEKAFSAELSEAQAFLVACPPIIHTAPDIIKTVEVNFPTYN